MPGICNTIIKRPDICNERQKGLVFVIKCIKSHVLQKEALRSRKTTLTYIKE